MVSRNSMIQSFLLLFFIAFTIGSVALINVCFTIVPFSIYGEPIQITVSIGFVLLLLALITLVLFLRRRRK